VSPPSSHRDCGFSSPVLDTHLTRVDACWVWGSCRYTVVPRPGDLLHGFLRSVGSLIHAALRSVPCVLTTTGDWCRPSHAVVAAKHLQASFPACFLAAAFHGPPGAPECLT
jgi:hypothetical protein